MREEGWGEGGGGRGTERRHAETGSEQSVYSDP